MRGGGAIGRCGLGEERSGDVAVSEGKEGDGELAGGVGSEGGAGWTGENELARQGDVEGEGLCGEVIDGELARAAESAVGSGTVADLVGEDLEAGVFEGVAAGEWDGVGGRAGE